MSGVLGAVGKIAGVVSAVAMFIPGGQPIAAAAALVATAANIGAQITAVPPPRQGSVSQTTIGTDQDSPWIVGRTYYGGARVQLVGYGATLKKVKNPYLLAADVHSVGGPVDGLEAIYADLAPITVGGGAVAEANGYFNDHLWRSFQLGQQVEAAALPLRFAGAPGWAGDARLSGKAAIAYNALFDRDGEVFASGFSQMGAVWRGARCWNPVADSTYTGGAGASRWAAPGNTAAHDAARATWAFTRSPGLLALRYALGVYERDTRVAGSTYRKTFGAGIPLDGLIVEQFVHLHNVCVANSWNCDGVLFEPSSSKWDNLKRILAAGGAEPCWVGGRLGVRVNAPRIALDTITADDLADGEIVVGAMQGWEQRLNTIVPKYRSETHRWEYVATDPVQIATYLAEDGEEKREERQYDLVQDPTQVRQLAAYELLDRRELGEIELPCKPRLRRYGPGDLLTINLPDAGLVNQPAVVLRRTLDPATMGVTLVLRGETMTKHDFALGRTGTPPPTPALVATPSLDEIALERPVSWDTISDPAGTKPEDNATVGAPDGTNIGGRPVTDVLAAFDAAQAQQNHFETVTIPAVEKSVADAGVRITDARGRADAAYDRAGQAIDDADTVNRRVDQIIASGGGGSEGVDSVARAEILRVDETAIQRDAAVARSVETLSASYASGAGNLLGNTDFPTLDGWQLGHNGVGATLGLNVAGDYWRPIGENVLTLYQAGPATGGGYSEATSLPFAVTAGSFVQFYAFTAAHRCDAWVSLFFYDVSGNYVGYAGENTALRHNNGGRDPAEWERVGRIAFQVPAGVVAARMVVRKSDSFAGANDSHAWFWRPYVGAAREGQTSWNPYAAGSAKPVVIESNALIERKATVLAEADAALARETTAVEARLNNNIAASARDVTTAFTDADRALGSRTSVLEASASGPVAGSLNPNPSFSGWTDAGTTPDGWAYWNVIDKATRIVDPLNRGGYAVEHTPTNVNSGIVCGDIFVPKGWYVMEAIVRKTAGSWAGAGVTLSGQHGIDFNVIPDNAGVVGDAPDGVRAWSFLFQVRDDFIGPGVKNWHAMSNWTGFAGALVPKTLWWMHCALRPASQGEIEANKATNVLIPEVAARVKTTEDTLADLPNRYAAASRTTVLEAQINRQSASPMNDALVGVANSVNQAEDRVNARIETRATAIADEKAGAVSTTLQQLRTEYDGAYGQLQQVAGSVTGLDGRSEVYWRVTGTTNDGATSIELTKKDGSSPLFYIGANTLIDGALMVTGTITSRTIQNGAVTNYVTTTGGTYGFSQNTVRDTGTAALSVSGTGFVKIDVRLSTNYVDGESGMTAPNQWFLALYCEQGGQQRLVGSTTFREGPYISFWDVDVPSAGTATYIARVTLSVAQRNGTVFNTKINAVEYKK